MKVKKLKVYGGCFDGTYSVAVATATKKEAAEAIGVSLYGFNQCGGETGHVEAVKAALSSPGEVFARHSCEWKGPYRPIKEVRGH